MNWDNTDKWLEKANDGKESEWFEPRWSFDCGLKLDFDGGLLRVSSRFYQQGDNLYTGSVSFIIGNDEVFMREFSSRHIDVLKTDVEKYVKQVTENIKALCASNLAEFVRSKS